MGVFSQSFYDSSFIPEVGMNEDYTTGTDMMVALYEAKMNEYSVLEAGIKMDVLAAMHEGVERNIINEATASGVLGKIKAILTKLLEKIKAIFRAFMAKINSFFMDSDKFFKRYSTDIAKKDFKDFEIKARKPEMSYFEKILSYTQDTVSTGIITKIGNVSVDWTQQADVDKVMESDFISKKVINDVFTDECIKGGSLDEDSDISKEIEDWIFDDAETHDNLRSTDILTSDWIGGLLNKKKFISDIEKQNRKSEKKIENLIRNIDKDMTKVAKALGTKDTSYSSSSHEVKYESYSYDDIVNMEEEYSNIFESMVVITEAKVPVDNSTDIWQYVQTARNIFSNKNPHSYPDSKIFDSLDISYSKETISALISVYQTISNAINSGKQSAKVKDSVLNTLQTLDMRKLEKDLEALCKLDKADLDNNRKNSQQQQQQNSQQQQQQNSQQQQQQTSTSKTLGITVTTLTDTNDKDQLNSAIKSIAWLQSYFSKYQDYMVKGQNARLSCAKKAMAQARKIFAAAVAYNPKKEDYEFYTAVGESAEFEAIMAME